MGIFIPITVAFYPIWFWFSSYKKNSYILLLHNLFYIISFTIYFYLLSDFTDNDYILIIIALILLNSIILMLSSFFNPPIKIICLFVANVIGMIVFGVTTLSGKEGPIASISAIAFGIMLFFFLFALQIKDKESKLFCCTKIKNFGNQDFLYASSLFNFAVHWLISLFAIGIVCYYIGKGLSNIDWDFDSEALENLLSDLSEDEEDENN